MFDLRDQPTQCKLNSLTKYPPIPTFHEISNKGMLDGSKPLDFQGKAVAVTEKIDGTNGRIITIPARLSVDGRPHWVIGSRENLLTCDQDWMMNPGLGIVDELAGTAWDLMPWQEDVTRVYFFEVYGSTVGANGREYSRKPGTFGHRLFDVIELEDDLFTSVMDMDLEKVSSWRQHGGQTFVGWDDFLGISTEEDLERVPIIEPTVMPEGIAFDGLQNTLETLKAWFPDGGKAVLDPELQGLPEGVVFKSHDRKITAKLRFQDYRSTIARLAKDEARKTRERIVE